MFKIRTTLAFAALAAAALSAAQTTLTATLTSSVGIDNGLFAYQSADGSDQGAAGLTAILPNVAYSGSATVKGSLTDYLTYRYTLVGTYGALDDGIVIGLNPTDSANAVGRSFTDVFGTATSEASLVSYTKSAYRVFNGSTSFGDLLGAAALQSFLSGHKSMLEQGLAGGSLVSFSNGAIVGGLVAVPANPAPEPSALAALGVGAVAFARRRRRG